MFDNLKIRQQAGTGNLWGFGKIDTIIINFKTKNTKILTLTLTFLELILQQRPSLNYILVGKKYIKNGCYVTLKGKNIHLFLSVFLNSFYGNDLTKKPLLTDNLNKDGSLHIKFDNLLNHSLFKEEIDKFQNLKDGHIELFTNAEAFKKHEKVNFFNLNSLPVK